MPEGAERRGERPRDQRSCVLHNQSSTCVLEQDPCRSLTVSPPPPQTASPQGPKGSYWALEAERWEGLASRDSRGHGQVLGVCIRLLGCWTKMPQASTTDMYFPTGLGTAGVQVGIW